MIIYTINLKLTTDRHEVSRGLSVTAALYLQNTAAQQLYLGKSHGF